MEADAEGKVGIILISRSSGEREGGHTGLTVSCQGCGTKEHEEEKGGWDTEDS